MKSHWRHWLCCRGLEVVISLLAIAFAWRVFVYAVLWMPGETDIYGNNARLTAGQQKLVAKFPGTVLKGLTWEFRMSGLLKPHEVAPWDLPAFDYIDVETPEGIKTVRVDIYRPYGWGFECVRLRARGWNVRESDLDPWTGPGLKLARQPAVTYGP